jgi:hypothetical protein
MAQSGSQAPRDERNRIRRMVLVRMTAAGVTPLWNTILSVTREPAGNTVRGGGKQHVR